MNDYPYWVNPSTHTHCVARGCNRKIEPGDPDQTPGPRYAVPGTDLCNWHHTRFPRLLIDLAELWPSLEQALYKKSSGQTNTKVSSSGLRDIAQTWNPHVTEVMAELADWTRFLVRTVLRERPLPEPEITTYDQTDTQWVDGEKRVIVTSVQHIVEHTHGLTTDVPIRLGLAALAQHHARWLSAYPLLGPALLEDAQDHRRDALMAIQSTPVRRVGLKGATCGEVVDVLGAHEFTCQATMVGILGRDDRPSVVVCSAHPKTHRQYTKNEWMAWTK